MDSCVVCNQDHSNKISLDHKNDSGRTLRKRLGVVVLDKMISGQKWMCQPCQFDLNQIETLLIAFKKRYWDSAQQHQVDCIRVKAPGTDPLLVDCNDMGGTTNADVNMTLEVDESNDFTTYSKVSTNSRDEKQVLSKVKVFEHHPFSCGICGTYFKRCTALDKHMKTHSHQIVSTQSDEPLQKQSCMCPVCGKDFFNRISLKVHSAIHTVDNVEETATRCPDKEENEPGALNTSSEETVLINPEKEGLQMIEHGKTPQVKDINPEEVVMSKSDDEIRLPNRINDDLCHDAYGEESEVDSDKSNGPDTVIPTTHPPTANNSDKESRRSSRCKDIPPKSVKDIAVAPKFKAANCEPPAISNNEEKQFACSVCSELFKTRTAKQRHEEIHSGLRTHICQKCGDGFKDKVQYKKHVKTHTSKKHACNYCDAKFFKKSALKRHLTSHTGLGYFQCGICNVGMKSKASLERHTRTHTGEKPFKCKFCQKTFTQSGNLHNHERTHTGEKPHRCHLCEAAFSQLGSLHKHMVGHTEERPFRCNICGKAFKSAAQVKEHTLTHSAERFRCTVCGKDFVRKKSLDIHIRTHTGEKPFTCEVCDSSFRARHLLREHYITLHTEQGPNTQHVCWKCGKIFKKSTQLKYHIKTHMRAFLCSVCNKRYVTASSLKQHMMLHTGEKPYTCDECGKSFITTGNLNVHKRQHTNERPYPCTECDKTFRQAMALKSHAQTHTDAWPFTCPLCGKSFRRALHLQRHMKTHPEEGPFACTTCGKLLKRMKTLHAHLLTHTTQPQFTCHICSKQFRRRVNLKNHLQTHTDVRPFPCSKCGKAFRHSATLKRHLWKHFEPMADASHERPVDALIEPMVMVMAVPTEKKQEPNNCDLDVACNLMQ